MAEEARKKPGNFDSLHASQLFYSSHRLGIPQVRYQRFDAPQWIAPYRVRTTAPPEQGAIHFFLDDYRFETAWNRPRKTLMALRKYGAVMTPDYSLFTEYPLSMQIWNTYRNRWVGAYWQQQNLTVIPCLSWSTPESFDFCFCGLDKGCVVATSSLATLEGPGHSALFCEGYREMIRQTDPRLVLCYGTLADDSLKVLAPVIPYPTRSWKKGRLLWANGEAAPGQA